MQKASAASYRYLYLPIWKVVFSFATRTAFSVILTRSGNRVAGRNPIVVVAVVVVEVAVVIHIPGIRTGINIKPKDIENNLTPIKADC